MTTPQSNPTVRNKGAFFAIEGGDGVGKSTVIPFLAAALEETTGRKVHVFREPGGTPFGEDIRTVVKRHGVSPTGVANVLAFSASRAELMARKIRPAVESGDIVLADRFLLSTYMYQGRGQGVPAEAIARITEIAVDGMYPDATLVLTLSREEWLARHGSRAHEDGDAFEEDAQLAQRVQDAYLEDARMVPGTIVVSARGTPSEIVQRIIDVIKPVTGRLFQKAPKSQGRGIAGA